jgi:hypothetical protein
MYNISLFGIVTLNSPVQQIYLNYFFKKIKQINQKFKKKKKKGSQPAWKTQGLGESALLTVPGAEDIGRKFV